MLGQRGAGGRRRRDDGGDEDDEECGSGADTSVYDGVVSIL